MLKTIYASTFGLIAAVVISGYCWAGSPVPCKDTEHPNEPPCNMTTCRRPNGQSNTCNHYCTKGKGCCFCKKDQCDTMNAGPGSELVERPL